MNQSFSLHIKEDLFNFDNYEPIKKICCWETVFLSLLEFKNYHIHDNNLIEIKLEENYINSLFKNTLEKLKIVFEEELLISTHNKYLHKYAFDSSFVTQNITKNLTIPEKKCCKQNWLRTAFLCSGYVGNPEKNYHLEFTSSSIENINKIQTILDKEGLISKVYKKNIESENYVLYIKKSDDIIYFLGLIGANKYLLEVENLKITKEIKNKVMRQINYETANIQKTSDAAAKQINAIEWAVKTGFFNDLPDTLKEVARLRLNHPDKTFQELCELFPKPITKSGINHRLRRLYGIIQNEKNKIIAD